LKFKTCIDVTKIHDELDTFGLHNFYNKHKCIGLIDNKLNASLKGFYFRAYLPHVFHPAMQIIATHPNCKELHIMEEGVNAYSNYLMNFKDKSPVKEIIKTALN